MKQALSGRFNPYFQEVKEGNNAFERINNSIDAINDDFLNVKFTKHEEYINF